MLTLSSPSTAHARTDGDGRCLALPQPVAAPPLQDVADTDCGDVLAAAVARPRRTEGLSAVLFTAQVWPEASFESALNADTDAAPGRYALTVGHVRLTARPTPDPDRVSATVEVTNLSACLLLLGVRFLDDGEYVSDPWLVRVRSRRPSQEGLPVLVELPDVRLLTPVAQRTSANAFSAELTARFVDCGRRARRPA